MLSVSFDAIEMDNINHMTYNGYFGNIGPSGMQKTLRSFFQFETIWGQFVAPNSKWPKCIPSSPMMIVHAKKIMSGGQNFRLFTRNVPLVNKCL